MVSSRALLQRQLLCQKEGHGKGQKVELNKCTTQGLAARTRCRCQCLISTHDFCVIVFFFCGTLAQASNGCRSFKMVSSWNTKGCSALQRRYLRTCHQLFGGIAKKSFHSLVCIRARDTAQMTPGGGPRWTKSTEHLSTKMQRSQDICRKEARRSEKNIEREGSLHGRQVY